MKHRYWLRDDGATVEVWEATCGICGFRTGLARVSWPDGRSIMITGAGCKTEPRRDREEAERWAASQ